MKKHLFLVIQTAVVQNGAGYAVSDDKKKDTNGFTKAPLHLSSASKGKLIAPPSKLDGEHVNMGEVFIFPGGNTTSERGA